jgi:hypothetical protein
MQAAVLINADSVDAGKGIAFQVELQGWTGRQLAPLLSDTVQEFFRCNGVPIALGIG